MDIPSLRRPHIHRLRPLSRPRINTNINRRIQPIRNRLADQTNFHNRVVTPLFPHIEQRVLRVQGLFLRVCVVRGCFFDLAEEVLLNVELADVRDGAARDGVVGEEGGAVVDDCCAHSQWEGKGEMGMSMREVGRTVKVVCAADVVARNDGDEGSCAVGTGGLETTERVGLDGSCRAVAVTLCLHACVDAGGVAAPELDVGVGYGLAAGGVDYVDVEVRDGALLACEEILSDELARNPSWRLAC